jgi:hypothetical protein
MGEVVNIAAARRVGPKLRSEPQGYLLVPARVLEPLARFEASINAFAADHSNTGVGFDWDAWYRLTAILELATRYQ